MNNDIEKHKNSEQKVTLVRCRSLHVILFALADNPYAVKEVDKAEDFDVNRSAEKLLSNSFGIKFNGVV